MSLLCSTSAGKRTRAEVCFPGLHVIDEGDTSCVFNSFDDCLLEG